MNAPATPCSGDVPATTSGGSASTEIFAAGTAQLADDFVAQQQPATNAGTQKAASAAATKNAGKVLCERSNFRHSARKLAFPQGSFARERFLSYPQI